MIMQTMQQMAVQTPAEAFLGAIPAFDSQFWHDSETPVILGILAVTMAMQAVVSLPYYFRKRLGSGGGGLWWVAAIIVASVAIVVQGDDSGVFTGRPDAAEFGPGGLTHHTQGGSYDYTGIYALIQLSACGGLVMFVVPLALRLWNKWTGKSLTDAERLPTGESLRSWFGGTNVSLILLVSLCAWLGLGVSFWAVLILTGAAVAVYPLVNMMSQSGQPAGQPPPPVPVEDLAPQRERVLKMLEEGKVTAEEGAELLAALGASARPAAGPPPPPRATSGGRKLVIVGAILVLVGFFLPWYSVDIASEIQRMGRTISPPMGEVNGIRVHIEQGMPKFNGTVRTNGSDVHYGMGWMVLALAGIAVIAPFAPIHPRTARMIGLLSLSLGAVILLLLVFQGLRYVSVGLVLTMAGYALALIATGVDRPRPQAAPAV